MKFIKNVFRYLTSASAQGELSAKFFLRTRPTFSEFYIHYKFYRSQKDSKFNSAYLKELSNHSHYPQLITLLLKS